MPNDQAKPFVKKDFSTLVNTLLKDIRIINGGRKPLTDTHEGSVVRTLVEVFAHEMAVSYEQLERVYQNAYLDTARGSALDKVVDLLAIKRYKAGRLEGSVTFARTTAATETIHIPAGTLVAGRGVVHCATLQAARLEKGQTQVRVSVVSQENSDQPIAAKALNTMPSPITGIETVINEGDLNSRQRAESDEELRQRAHRLIQASRSGTTAALEEAVRTLGLKQIKILEYTGYDNPNTTDTNHESDALTPGMIKVVVGDKLTATEKQAVMQEVEKRILEVKPAGVMVRCLSAPVVEVRIAAILTLNSAQTRQQKQQIEAKLSQKLNAYFEQLAIGESVYHEKIKALLLNHPNVQMCEALQGRSSLLQLKSSQYKDHLNLNIKGHERIILDSNDAVRLILQNPYSPVLLTISVTLKKPAAVTEILKANMQEACANQIKQLKDSISANDFWVILKEKSPEFELSSLHITVVHLSNGLTIELTQKKALLENEITKQDKDTLAANERPELNQFIVDEI